MGAAYGRRTARACRESIQISQRPEPEPTRCAGAGVGDHSRMAYDEDLANRVRELIAAEAGLTEKKMFGGLAFLIRGNMSVGVSGRGGVVGLGDPGGNRPPGAQPP